MMSFCAAHAPLLERWRFPTAKSHFGGICDFSSVTLTGSGNMFPMSFFCVSSTYSHLELVVTMSVIGFLPRGYMSEGVRLLPICRDLEICRWRWPTSAPNSVSVLARWQGAQALLRGSSYGAIVLDTWRLVGTYTCIRTSRVMSFNQAR